MVERRMWISMSPLRQFDTIQYDLIKKLERKDFPFERYFDLNPQELGEFSGVPKAGKLLYKYIQATITVK
jgi:pre-mRNA-splicing helicase BRR2